MSQVTIYHNPACSNSRKTLALLRERGIEPTVIEYLKNPPDRATLCSLVERMGTGARSLLRAKGELYEQLGLANPAHTDDQIIDAMAEHPALINRPVVVTPKGVRLCRPPEKVLELI